MWELSNSIFSKKISTQTSIVLLKYVCFELWNNFECISQCQVEVQLRFPSSDPLLYEADGMDSMPCWAQGITKSSWMPSDFIVGRCNRFREHLLTWYYHVLDKGFCRKRNIFLSNSFVLVDVSVFRKSEVRVKACQLRNDYLFRIQ